MNNKILLKKTALLLALLTPLLFLFQSGLSAVDYPYQKGSFLYFLGEGKANPSMENKTQKRSLSKEASILEGKAKIAAYIHKLKMKNGEAVENVIAKNKNIKIKVSAFLDGVQTVKSTWDNEDNCKTILKINKKKILQKLKARE